MLFFNKTEQDYWDDFSANHKKLKPTYFAPYQSRDELFISCINTSMLEANAKAIAG